MGLVTACRLLAQGGHSRAASAMAPGSVLPECLSSLPLPAQGSEAPQRASWPMELPAWVCLGLASTTQTLQGQENSSSPSSVNPGKLPLQAKRLLTVISLGFGQHVWPFIHSMCTAPREAGRGLGCFGGWEQRDGEYLSSHSQALLPLQTQQSKRWSWARVSSSFSFGQTVRPWFLPDTIHSAMAMEIESSPVSTITGGPGQWIPKHLLSSD